MNSTVISYADHNTFPSISIANHPFNGNYAITTNCIAAHIFSIIISIILFIPSSKETSNKKNFIWRKIKTLTIAVGGIHLLNIFRIVFLLFFNYQGIPFEFIHESLFFLSAIIGALFIAIILKKWLPELFISIYYTYFLISQKRRTIT
jgi:exosortase/archaeosortase family protein